MSSTRQSRPPSATGQLEGFIARYSPEIAREGRAALRILVRRMPGAVRLVYDNYNFPVVGFGPSDRPSEAVLSLAFAPRWLALCFLLSGTRLRDPEHLLRGSGSRVRNVRFTTAAELNRPAVRDLIAQALRLAPVPIPRRGRGRLIIRSVSARQRPRRPPVRRVRSR